jgi:hypothetical protein
MANTTSHASGESIRISNDSLAVELGDGHGERRFATTATPTLRSADGRLNFRQSQALGLAE